MQFIYNLNLKRIELFCVVEIPKIEYRYHSALEIILIQTNYTDEIGTKFLVNL